MIIRRQGDSLLFMTQPDHARLAADLLAHWTADGFASHPRREAVAPISFTLPPKQMYIKFQERLLLRRGMRCLNFYLC